MKQLLNNDGVQIAIDKQEPCISHKSIAHSLGVDNRSMYRLIIEYQSEVTSFGKVRFENAPLTSGQRERIAYLSENQCYFILTLTRNTAKAVQAKSALVMAFSKAREALIHRQTQYLPMYHTAHDSIQSIACRARASGSTTPESIYHMNYEKLVNKVIGLDAGQRKHLNVSQQCAVTLAYATIGNILNDAAQRGLDHKQAYQMVKDNLPKVVALLGISPRLAA